MTKTLITKKALQCQINEEIQRKNPSRNRRRRLNEDMTLDEAYGMLGDFIESQRSTISNTLSKYGFEPDFDFNAEDAEPYIELIPTNKHIKDNFEDIILYVNFIMNNDTDIVPYNNDLSDARMKLYAEYKPYGSDEYHLENTNKYQCTVPEIPKIISLILRDLNKRLILVGKSHDPFNQGDFKIIDNTLVAYKGNDSDVTIPDGVKSIGDYAFKKCAGLTSIKIPNSVTYIGRGAFINCKNLTSIIIPNSVTSIGESVFSGCISLTSIKIPNSATSIGRWAFEDCTNLTSITIPNSVTKISDNVFSGCISLTSITIPNSVTSIGRWAFSSCESLKSITIPNSVKSIGESVFENCESLKSVTLPNSLTSIGEWAFSNCKNLVSITIPNSVTRIGKDAFDDCNNLTDIKIPERFKDENTLKEIGLNDKQIDNLLDNYTWD